MVDGLDVVAVRVEEEGGIVAGVVGALAGGAVVTAARGEAGGVEAPDRLAVGGLEGEVDARDRPVDGVVGPVDIELVDGEVVVGVVG